MTVNKQIGGALKRKEQFENGGNSSMLSGRGGIMKQDDSMNAGRKSQNVNQSENNIF